MSVAIHTYINMSCYISKVPSELKEYLSQREVIDVVVEFKTGGLSVHEFLSHLKPLQPRFYSIASSPQVVSRWSAHCTTNVIVNPPPLVIDQKD